MLLKLIWWWLLLKLNLDNFYNLNIFCLILLIIDFNLNNCIFLFLMLISFNLIECYNYDILIYFLLILLRLLFIVFIYNYVNPILSNYISTNFISIALKY